MTVAKIKSKRPIGLCLMLPGVSLRSPAQGIKHRTDEYEVWKDSVVTEYQGVLISGHVGPQSEVVRWAHGLV